MDKAAAYARIRAQLAELIRDVPRVPARMATACALLIDLDHVSWVGFYLPENDGGLSVGPYQGAVASLRLPPGKGVCGAAAAGRKTVIVDDVHAFPGHIACDPDSRSEIVVPLLRGDELLAVLDVDSHLPAAFDRVDRESLEAIARALVH